MLWSAENEHPRQIRHDSFKVFQPICDHDTIRQRHRQPDGATDRQTTTYRGNTAIPVIRPISTRKFSEYVKKGLIAVL